MIRLAHHLNLGFVILNVILAAAAHNLFAAVNLGIAVACLGVAGYFHQRDKHRTA